MLKSLIDRNAAKIVTYPDHLASLEEGDCTLGVLSRAKSCSPTWAESVSSYCDTNGLTGSDVCLVPAAMGSSQHCACGQRTT